MEYQYVVIQNNFDKTMNNYWFCKNLKTNVVSEYMYFSSCSFSNVIVKIANSVAEGAFLLGLEAFSFHKKYSSEKVEFCQRNNIVEVCFWPFLLGGIHQNNCLRFHLFYSVNPSPDGLRFERSRSFVSGNLTFEFCICFLIYLFQQKNINYTILF